MIFNSAYERGDYDFLYANYMGGSHALMAVQVHQLLAESPVRVAVDLCAGSGAMTLPLMRWRVPEVYAVDKSPALLAALRGKVQPLDAIDTSLSLIQIDLNQEGAIDYIKGALSRSNDYRADLVTCRQAIGYLSEKTLLSVPRLLAPGGRFVFNTFDEPPKGQLWRHRREDGIYEAGFYALGRVFHLQARWPRLDATMFWWHDAEKLRETWEGRGLDVVIDRHGRSLFVTVTRKREEVAFH